MTGRMTRRQALGAAAVGGAGLVGGLGGSVEATAATSQHTASPFLPDVWGEDFMLQWSPADDLQKDLTVRASHVRLSCHAHVLNPYGNKDQPRRAVDSAGAGLARSRILSCRVLRLGLGHSQRRRHP